MRKLSSKGYTLVEVSIALAIAAALIITLMGFALTSLVNYTVAAARSEVLSETQAALDIVNNDIRLSASADQNNRWEDTHAPGAPGNLYSWQSDGDTIVLATVAEDDDGDILFADSAQYISHKNNTIYFLENGILYKRVLAAPSVAGNVATTTCPAAAVTASCPADRALLHNVTNFDVQYLDGENNEVTSTNARSVEITISSSTRKYGQDVAATYTTRTVFRND